MKEIRNTKEELTTDMHMEFIGDEIPQLDLYVMSVYGATQRGIPLQEALAEHRLTEKQYLENVDRVVFNR